MARYYSTRNFFRQMPNALLARYFQGKGLLADLDLAGMSETKPDALMSAWLALPNDQRNKMDADFRDIHDLCDEGGFVAIRDEADWIYRTDPAALDAFVTSLSSLPDHYERAMVTFLDFQPCWNGATRFHHADRLGYWRKRKNLPHRPAAVDGESIRDLAGRIGTYFHHTEGRGKNCVVEPLRRGDRDYFFAYPEDHSQRSLDWVNGEFEARPRNPAFEVVFVYSQAEGSLDLNFRGSPKAIDALQSIFAHSILKLDELPPDPKDNRVYDLDPLKRKGFEFTYKPGSGIEKVVVKKVRLSSRGRKGDRITVEADSTQEPQAVYDLIETISKGLPLGLYSVTQVEIAVTMAPEVGNHAKTLTLRITHPNSCSLKYDELDLKLRDMLAASGIEPKAPPAEVAAPAPS
jgi:hypothetical protein